MQKNYVILRFFLTAFFIIQVLNEANLTNAVLVRTVLTRSDLGGAIIDGADFSDAVLDLLQKQVSSNNNSTFHTW